MATPALGTPTPPPLSTTPSTWRLKRQQSEKQEAEAAQAATALQLARLHASSLHFVQAYIHADTGRTDREPEALVAFTRRLETVLTGAPAAVRMAVLLELKAGEANHRQVLLLTAEDDAHIVLKSCATDSFADAHAEHLTGLLAQRVGVSSPLVRASRQVTPIVERLRALRTDGRIVALPSEELQTGLWGAQQLSTPFIYAMSAAKGKTLLELRPTERRQLQPAAVLPAVGRLAALDALINNWDRWPLPTLWQKNRDYLGMSDLELREVCSPMRHVDSTVNIGALEADMLLRACGCNLGNVLFHALTSAVASIDTCIIPGAPTDYDTRVGALVDEVIEAHEAKRASRGLRVFQAVMAAALQIDDPGYQISASEQSELLQRGFLEGLVRAAELSNDELAALEVKTLEGTDLVVGAAKKPALLSPAVRDSVTKHVGEAKQLVERTIAVVQERLPRILHALLPSPSSP